MKRLTLGTSFTGLTVMTLAGVAMCGVSGFGLPNRTLAFLVGIALFILGSAASRTSTH